MLISTFLKPKTEKFAPDFEDWPTSVLIGLYVTNASWLLKKYDVHPESAIQALEIIDAFSDAARTV